jgi:hypothetical protein
VPAVDFGNVVTNNDNASLSVPPYNPSSTEFRHTGGDIYLPPGTYYFTNVLITGGPIRVDGPVTIYVQGDVNVSGNAIVNETQIPANLKIFAEGKDVKVAGTSAFWGLIYSPTSNIEIAGGAAFFGAAVGKTLKLHNDAGSHADESLAALVEFPSRCLLVD